MHEQWSCFAIISIDSSVHAEKSRDILVYKKMDRRDGVSTFQFPGGSKEYGDANPMVTLQRTVRDQTGIDLSRFSTVRRACYENTNIRSTHTGGRVRKHTNSVRYYQLHIEIDLFLDRTGFEMDKNEIMQWMHPEAILRSEDFSEADKTALQHCLNS
ncbi:MAG: NUDIX hydrolase [Nitrospirota bacterium]|nr:NUDIX hydrolase [Nitrospirota bacterium]